MRECAAGDRVVQVAHGGGQIVEYERRTRDKIQDRTNGHQRRIHAGDACDHLGHGVLDDLMRQIAYQIAGVLVDDIVPWVRWDWRGKVLPHTGAEVVSPARDI